MMTDHFYISIKNKNRDIFRALECTKINKIIPSLFYFTFVTCVYFVVPIFNLLSYTTLIKVRVFNEYNHGCRQVVLRVHY